MRTVRTYIFVNGYRVRIQNIMITGCYEYTQIISLPCVYYYSEFLFLIVNVLAGEEKPCNMQVLLFQYRIIDKRIIIINFPIIAIWN